MKRTIVFAIVTGMALSLPMAAFSADQRYGKGGGGGGGGHAAHSGGGGGGPRPAVAAAPHVSAPARHFSTAGGGGGSFHPSHVTAMPTHQLATRHFNAPATNNFAAQSHRRTLANTSITSPASPNFRRTNTAGNNRFGTAGVNRSSRFNTAGVNAPNARVNSANAGNRSFTVNNHTYSRANAYGGRWTAGNTHSGWSHDGEHMWHHHHYRWFDGGWLIVDGGFWPPDYGYYGPDYYGYDYGPDYGYNYPPTVASYNDGNNIAAEVQSRLAQLGYYQGGIDGDVGPMTRNALAAYQSDNGLDVTGTIDGQVLQSMNLQ